MILWSSVGNGNPVVWSGNTGAGRCYRVEPHPVYPSQWTACRVGAEFNKMLSDRNAAMSWCEGVEAALMYAPECGNAAPGFDATMMELVRKQAEYFNAKAEANKREPHKDEIPMECCGEPKVPESFGGFMDALNTKGYSVGAAIDLQEALRTPKPVAYAIECEPGDPKLHSLSFWQKHLDQIVTAHGGKVIPLYRRP